MKNHCWRCKHHRSWHQTGKDDQVECECRSHGCTCNSFWNTPKEIEQPNSRLRSVKPNGPCLTDKEQIAKRMDYSAYGDGVADVFMEAVREDQTAQRIAMKQDEDILGPHHTWQDLHDIATEARDGIYDTWNSSLHGAEQMSQVHQIVRRAMHEARRPVLEKLSEQPTQREPEKPPEPLSKSKEPCPVCMSLTMKYWRNSSDRYLYECSTCHVVLAVPLSARRDISKAPGVGAGAVGEPEVTAR